MLSEIDLKDWIEQPSIPLHDVPEETPIKTHVGMLWYSQLGDSYSLCFDLKGNPVRVRTYATVNPYMRRKDNE